MAVTRFLQGCDHFSTASLREFLAGKPDSTPNTDPYGFSVKYGNGSRTRARKFMEGYPPWRPKLQAPCAVASRRRRSVALQFVSSLSIQRSDETVLLGLLRLKAQGSGGTMPFAAKYWRRNSMSPRSFSRPARHFIRHRSSGLAKGIGTPSISWMTMLCEASA